MTDKTLTVLFYNRPKYLAETLSHLEQCHGIEDYRVVFYTQGPVHRETHRLAKRFAATFPSKSADVVVDYGIPAWLPGYKKCSRATKRCLDHAFLKMNARFHVHLEDDIVPARDFLRYMEWADQAYEHDTNVFTVCGFHRPDNVTRENAILCAPGIDHTRWGQQEATRDENPHRVYRRAWFTPWGWGTWRDRWPQARSHIRNSWDHDVNHKARGARHEVVPILSRVKNIGAVQGANVPDPQWHLENQANTVWSDGIANNNHRHNIRFHEHVESMS